MELFSSKVTTEFVLKPRRFLKEHITSVLNGGLLLEGILRKL